MINITDKHKCCGCAACAQRCPKQCIVMQEDDEGFLYPVVNRAACIDCRLCEKVCPMLRSLQQKPANEVLAIKNRNTADRMDSSSGGVFIALAQRTVATGGAVFGAVYDGKWEVAHSMADTPGGIRPMMGSKYMQSRTGDSFSHAERLLKSGRDVLFSGTPCQIAGLHAFLQKDYSNLLSVDIACHGVPSVKVWRKYIEETFLRQDASTEITYVNFRDKQKEGWRRYNVVIKGRRNAGSTNETELSASVYVDNPFMRGFMSDVYLRPACHRCLFKCGACGSDLTIADYWGADLLMPDFADDKGVSLVIVNSDKGRKALNGLDTDARQTTLDGVERHNGGFTSAPPEKPLRHRFFADIDSGTSFDDALGRALHVPAYVTAAKNLRKVIKNTIKKLTK